MVSVWGPLCEAGGGHCAVLLFHCFLELALCETVRWICFKVPTQNFCRWILRPRSCHFEGGPNFCFYNNFASVCCEVFVGISAYSAFAGKWNKLIQRQM